VLSAAQVIPFLLHDQPWVRDHALDYLADATDASPATADDLWNAIDVIPADERRNVLSRLAKFRQTPISTDRLIDALAQAPEIRERSHLTKALKKLDLAFVEANIDRIRALPAVPAEVVTHLEERLEMRDQPADEAWNQLADYSSRIEIARTNPDHDLVARLIESASRHHEITSGKVLEVLKPPSAGTWLEIWAAELVGLLRLESAAESMLAHLLVEEADYFTEELCRSLTRIGSAALIDRLVGFMKEADWGPRLSVSDVIGNIKLPASEALLVNLIKKEDDTSSLSFYAGALTKLCPTDVQSLELARSLILDGRYNPRDVDLRSHLAAVATMVDWEPPELKSWQKRAEDEYLRIKRLLNDPGLLEEFARRLAEAQYADTRPATIPEPPEHVPFRRASPKVGRNEPCPCGSGKKYKKCCGAKQDD
jgi:SEC-C motif-containing protein